MQPSSAAPHAFVFASIQDQILSTDKDAFVSGFLRPKLALSGLHDPSTISLPLVSHRWSHPTSGRRALVRASFSSSAGVLALRPRPPAGARPRGRFRPSCPQAAASDSAVFAAWGPSSITHRGCLNPIGHRTQAALDDSPYGSGGRARSCLAVEMHHEHAAKHSCLTQASALSCVCGHV